MQAYCYGFDYFNTYQTVTKKNTTYNESVQEGAVFEEKLDTRDNQSRRDIIGRTYECALTIFAEQERQDASDFYISSRVIQAMVEMLKPYTINVYAPACSP